MEQVNIEASYKFYRATVEEEHWITKDYKAGMKPYRNIVTGLMKFIMQKVFDGYDVKLGARLGVIGVRGRKVEPLINENGEIKGVAPNWGETKKLQARDPIAKEKRTIVYCFNEHSNFIKYKFFWANNRSIMTNITYYSLTFAHPNKSKLHNYIVNENREYQITENNHKK